MAPEEGEETEEGSSCETALAPIGEKMKVGFPPAPVRTSKTSERLTMMKASIRKILLGSLMGSLTAMTAVARAAEPEAAAPVDGSPPEAPQRTRVRVEQAPGLDLPPRIASDLRAAIDDALAGRVQPGLPIDVTVEPGGVVVRVGSLWRRVAIARWDYPALRTVALNVLDLSLPTPEMVEVAPGGPAPGPATTVVAASPTNVSATEHANDAGGPWSLHAGVAGARGAQLPDPWMVSMTAGLTWTHHDWLRIGVEIGWDHSIVRHVDSAGVLTTVNYDSTPFRLVLAAQNSTVMAGIRGGVAEYRVTGEQHFWVTTPVVGPFIAARVPIVGSFRGLLVGGFDYCARRTQLSGDGINTLYSTPAVAPYIGVVLEVGLTL